MLSFSSRTARVAAGPAPDARWHLGVLIVIHVKNAAAAQMSWDGCFCFVICVPKQVTDAQASLYATGVSRTQCRSESADQVMVDKPGCSERKAHSCRGAVVLTIGSSIPPITPAGLNPQTTVIN